MKIQSNALVWRPRAAALVAAASFLWMGATGAQAQFFNMDSALPAPQIERMVQASGYRLTGPVMRNGPVYLADVLGRENDPERLVIEANSGRLLQRYRAPARHERYVSNDWGGQPRQQFLGGWFDREDDLAPPRRQQPTASGDWSGDRPPASQSQGWFGREEEVAPPRPPARIGPTVGSDAASPHVPPANNVARGDDATAPYVIMGPDHAPAAAQDAPLEKPRIKPQARHRKPEPTPVAQPLPPPGAKPTPVAQPAAPAPSHSDAASEPASAPPPRVADTKSLAPSRPETTVTPMGPAPHVVETKPAAQPPQTAAAAPPAPKAPAHKPAVNDVPVDPLE